MLIAGGCSSCLALPDPSQPVTPPQASPAAHKPQQQEQEAEEAVAMQAEHFFASALSLKEPLGPLQRGGLAATLVEG